MNDFQRATSSMYDLKFKPQWLLYIPRSPTLRVFLILSHRANLRVSYESRDTEQTFPQSNIKHLVLEM